ncbi:hypothetical protein ElyMa_005381400 [Elysia marginata]|uniref:Uncharacterized protein n=1 Tax=Elysia marginata TaxID=1093978 RepID=A0AAV4EFJ3_9GAST|nr:hypothetical protein ElyMa_005381400 [Elysia marginata]
MQAKFAGLNKIVVKGQLLRDSLDTFLTVSSGFFHYHHEEVQYWVSVFTNMIRRPQAMPFHVLHRSSEIQQPVAHLQEIKIKYMPKNKECRVHILKQLTVSWTKEAHICLVEGIQDAGALVAKLKGQDGEVPGMVNKRTLSSGNRNSSVSVNIIMLADISLEAKLSDKNKVSLFTHNILVTMTLPDILMEVKDITINCDGHDIFRITCFQLETLAPSQLKTERERAKMLKLATNRAWYKFIHHSSI